MCNGRRAGGVRGFGTGLVLALAIGCLFAVVRPARAQNGRPAGVAAQDNRDTGTEPHAVRIELGMYLLDFARINGREETFDIEGYLDASWVDPALAERPGSPPRNRRDLHPDDVRMPNFEFINAIDQVRFSRDAVMHVDRDGRVTRRVRFSGKFASPMSLRKFPYDRQDLKVAVSVYDLAEDEFVLSVDGQRVGRSKYAFLSDWDIDTVAAHVEQRATDTRSLNSSAFIFTINVVRRNKYYFWRALLPMALLVAASWLVFWFEPTNLQPQISTALGILLSLVTFNFSIDFALPKVSYLTFIDRYALTSLVFVLLLIVAIAYVHVILQRKGVEAALRIQSIARVAFPAAYAIVILGIVASTLY